MATIDSWKIIDRIMKNNGYYDLKDKDSPDNQQAKRITEYTNMNGQTTWGVVFPHERIDKYQEPSIFIRNPKIIWEPKDD